MVFKKLKIYCADAPSVRLLPVLEAFLPYAPMAQVDARADATLELAVVPGLSARAEYFELNVEEERVRIAAVDYRGLVNATAALTQMITFKDGSFRIPNSKIADAPDASFRAFMIDPARNLIPMDELRALILSMAKSRLNKLHIHLSDSKGFAYASDVYPDLPPAPGGVYTRAELKEIIRYAGTFGIDVIPEIDVPAHSFATSAWLPELKCRVKSADGTYREDISGWNLCLGNEKTYDLIDALLQEVAEIFPYDYIHIGTDEIEMLDIDGGFVSHSEECEICHAFFSPLGLNTLRERFYWFLRRIYSTVTGLGKKMMMWNDDIDISKSPDLPRDILIEFWRVAAEQRGPVEGCSMQRFIDEGFEVINAHFEDTYIDEFVYWERLKAWDYQRDPADAGQHAYQILGGEMCAWEGSNYPHYLYVLYIALPLFGARLWDRAAIADEARARRELTRACLGCDLPADFDLFVYTKDIPLGTARFWNSAFADGADLESMRNVLKKLTHQSEDERRLTERLISMSEN